MTENGKIRLILADDHPLVLAGIRACLETEPRIELLAAVSDGAQALEAAARHPPDIAILDINMPNLNGLDAIPCFQEDFPEVKLIILSMHDDPEYVAAAKALGANGYLLKDISTEEIISAIEAVYSGQSYYCEGVTNALSGAEDEASPFDLLTSREQSVLLLLAEGKTNKDVARDLAISVRTVETHRKNLKKKLGIASTAGLTRYVIEHGLPRQGS